MEWYDEEYLESLADEIEELKRENKLLKGDIELYRHVIKESNDWLVASEGIDFCYHMDSEPKDLQLVRYILDNIKPR